MGGFDWFTPNLKCEDIVYIGLRDMDEFEINMIKKHNVKVYDMDAVTEKGIGKVLEETFEYFTRMVRPIPSTSVSTLMVLTHSMLLKLVPELEEVSLTEKPISSSERPPRLATWSAWTSLKSTLNCKRMLP